MLCSYFCASNFLFIWDLCVACTETKIANTILKAILSVVSKENPLSSFMSGLIIGEWDTYMEQTLLLPQLLFP